MREIRLTVTMRDIAAANHLAEVINPLNVPSNFRITTLAQAPASDLLLERSIDHIRVDLPNAQTTSSSEAENLLEYARQHLSSNPSDAILAGLSTPFDGGIDEAFLAQSDNPKFLLQDFWGEQNRFFGRGADIALVLDEAALARNAVKFGMRSIVVGSARHSSYANIDFPSLRKDVRRDLSVDDDQHVIGFFGQALNRLPGYGRTLKAFIRSLSEIKKKVIVVIKSHPRETARQRKELADLFEEVSVKKIFCNDHSVDTLLPACDIVCSLFSNCTYDASYQNWFSSEPLSVPVSLLFDPEIAEYYRERVEFEDLPIHSHGLVTPVYSQRDLVEILENSLHNEKRAHVWQKSKRVLPDPAQAISRIYESIAQEIDERRSGLSTY